MGMGGWVGAINEHIMMMAMTIICWVYVCDSITEVYVPWPLANNTEKWITHCSTINSFIAWTRISWKSLEQIHKVSMER